MPHAKLQAYMDATVAGLIDAREQVGTALALIAETLGNAGDPQPLQVLALRRYLRLGGKTLNANWSWTEDEAKRNRTVEPTKTLYAEAEKVREAFAAANPGYSLSLSPVRSLERQVELWNKNSTVNQAGLQLQQTMIKVLSDASYPGRPRALPSPRSLRICNDKSSRPSPQAPRPVHRIMDAVLQLISS